MKETNPYLDAQQRNFPVTLWAIDPNDPEYAKKDDRGRSPRYMVEMFDGARFYFPSQQDAEEFMVIHAMVAIPADQMTRMREAYRKRDKKQ